MQSFSDGDRLLLSTLWHSGETKNTQAFGNKLTKLRSHSCKMLSKSTNGIKNGRLSDLPHQLQTLPSLVVGRITTFWIMGYLRHFYSDCYFPCGVSVVTLVWYQLSCSNLSFPSSFHPMPGWSRVLGESRVWNSLILKSFSF